MRLLTISAAVCCLVFLAAPTLRADGPHWHVPNPDGEDDETLGPENGGQKKVEVPVPKGGNATRFKGVGDWSKNPGDFFKMDQPCIDYYERHCVIKYSKNKGNLDFYIKIMNRCAQAMREVDNYLPCPDSFPLWHTEELRELMVEYSQMTWQRSTMLDPKTAMACAEFCVQAYVDTVRFSEGRAKKNLAGGVQGLVDLNAKMVAILEKAANEPDKRKAQALITEWRALAKGGGVNTKGLIKAFETFKMITGDIPIQVDMAEARMLEGLANMGTIVLRPLSKHLNSPNPRVRKAVQSVVNYIRSKLSSPVNSAPTMSNVLTQLRYLQRKPGSIEANMAMKNLKNMGEAALPALVRIAENKNLGLSQLALNSMKVCSKKNFGLSLDKWKAYALELDTKAKTKAEADQQERQKERERADAADKDKAAKKAQPVIEDE